MIFLINKEIEKDEQKGQNEMAITPLNFFCVKFLEYYFRRNLAEDLYASRVWLFLMMPIRFGFVVNIICCGLS